MKRRNRLGLDAGEEPEIDMSPLIDLVFLLLIFFMTSSTMITYLRDHRVSLPVAEAARVPHHMLPRLVLNVYVNGSVGDERGNPVNDTDLADYLTGELERRPTLRLQIRSDRRVAHASVKKVLRAARASGIEDVLFSTYTTDL